MLVTGGIVLYVGRGTTFTGDEMVWVATSPGMSVESLLSAHGGHLQLIPRLVYRGMLEVFGFDYWAYRLLTVLASWLTVTLLFTWLVRRLPRLVALAPCLVLLVFGSDALHVIQGNGFTILVSVAAGLAALLMLDRDDRRGDAMAMLFLLIGVLTYGVALAFVAGVAVKVLVERRYRRWWVPAVPAAVYVIWWLWADQTNAGQGEGTASISNLLLVPSWAFQAVGSSADALTGLSFDFSTGAAPSFAFAAPLALLVIAFVGLTFARPEARRGLVTVLAIGLALWTLQALVAAPQQGGRVPSDARYLLPGAVVLLMIVMESARRITWTPIVVAAVWLVAIAGIGTNLKLLAAEGAAFRAQAVVFKDNVGAVALGFEAVPRPDVPRTELVTTQPGVMVGMSDLPWGSFGTDPGDLPARPPEVRARLDRMLATVLGVELSAAPGQAVACRRVEAGPDGVVKGSLPPGGAVLETPVATAIRIGRFSDAAVLPVGKLAPRTRESLRIPADSFDRPWTVGARAPWLRICDPGSRP